VASFLLLWVGPIAIAATPGLGAAGRCQVAYAVGGVGVSLVTALNQAWIPLLLGADREARWSILASTSEIVHRFAAAAAGALALIVPLGLAFAAPPSYDRPDLVPVAAVVAFSILPYATASTFFNVMFVGGRTRIMAVAAPAAALFNLGLNFLLLPVVGLVGASIATVAAYVLLAAIVAVASRRFVVVPGVLRSSLVAWALAAPVVLAGALLPPTPAGVGVRVALGAVLVAALVWQVRALRRTRHVLATG
jgi:O-antigen/teichoic acid export membrane protein